ncbi:HEAT repeat domain-containing protein [Streptomyces kutzneri]|uniref:HEAT repeat domain-containing protein n=1 Tax=Streptomyces kutzneri TaxID=3051179 RepID=UPI0028D5C26C|nr:HEAT repeat domain-containing protein [Streptomyces sp. DSM 40907]
MTPGGTDLVNLVTAVRADDAVRVRALLRAAEQAAPEGLDADTPGADAPAAKAPGGDALDVDAPGADGLSALDIAAARGSYPVVDALRTHGARLDRVGPDGRTPLLRAVDAGAYAVTELLVSSSVPLWPTGPAGRTALELARHWHETGAENELRHRTGATGPAEFSRVPDGEHSFTGLLRLPDTGAQVRTGHTAILCLLEAAHGIRPPFAELLARAETEAGLQGVTRDAAVQVLYRRADRETWQEAAALRAHPRPSVRHFGAEIVRCIALFDACEEGGSCGDGHACVAEGTPDLFLAWAACERAPEVLAVLLRGLPDCPALPRAARAEALLPHARHPSAVVRRAVAGAFGGCGDEEGVLPAVLEHLRDPDAEVRVQGCRALARQTDRSREVRNALRPLLADPSVEIQIEAVRALVLLDDPRGEEALDWLGYGYPEDAPGYWSLYDAHRHLRQKRAAGARVGPG